MLIDQVHFAKFSVDPQPLIDALPAYKPVAWGDDWEVACVPQGNAHTIYEWAKEHIEGRIDLVQCHDGSVLVGFTDPTDAILFKISYQ
jgi:hypothetical protein